MFLKYIIKHKPLMCGKIVDWVIRYETQGRGSLHAHILFWIDLNPDYIRDEDKIDLAPEILDRFHLRAEVERIRPPGTPASQSTQDAPTTPTSTQPDRSPDEGEASPDGDQTEAPDAGDVQYEKAYNEDYLNFTNGNIWALRKVANLETKLDIGARDRSELR